MVRTREHELLPVPFSTHHLVQNEPGECKSHFWVEEDSIPIVMGKDMDAS